MNNDLQEFKKAVVAVCREKLQESHEEITRQINNLQDSLQNESKSTAGDKHETGRAMMQLEIERMASRLKSREEELKLFERQVYGNPGDSWAVTPGSLVGTSAGIYFITVSLGVVTVRETPVMVVSPVSPVGRSLLGRGVGDKVAFNGKELEVEVIV